MLQLLLGTALLSVVAAVSAGAVPVAAVPATAMPMAAVLESAAPSATVVRIGARVLPKGEALFSMTPQPPWTPPLGTRIQVNRAFSLENGPYGAGHRGVDFPAQLEQRAHAPTSGVVSYVGIVVDRPVLSIRVDAETVMSFDALSSELRIGDRVERGQLIGIVAPGHCAAQAPCLHFGVRIRDVYVNPLRFLRTRPQLLPW